MLAATLEDLGQLRYPVYASAKLDGVRALVTKTGELVSRSLKPFPNPHVNKLFAHRPLAGLDGELIVGSPTAKDVFRVTSGALQRESGEPDVKFYVFDFWHRFLGFENVPSQLPHYPKEGVIRVEQYLVQSSEELLALEEKMLDSGYEGLILRSPGGLYKFGRSTAREQGMLKLKRFVDSEAKVTGYEEEMHNANAAKKNALGRTERSSAKAGLVGTGRMGTLLARDLKSGLDIRIGSGFTAADRENPPRIGSIVKYKYFQVGVKDLPRFPVYLGPRMKEDMS